MNTKAQLLGFKDLIVDAVENGSRVVEALHTRHVTTLFDAAERTERLAIAARGLRVLHDTAVANGYDFVRLTVRVAGDVLDASLLEEPPRVERFVPDAFEPLETLDDDDEAHEGFASNSLPFVNAADHRVVHASL